ncbi:BolA family protein [Legionella spiritensis]|uniref:BolA family protein n=1 Tax=Legionella spiritensis TaxID=452 RepID=UPI000F70369F|nr:BolA/IbaG family iron-sulfur metabolism protein [Legionella spiritensis]VEG90692.1 putative regulator of murein genes BolA [Legionella spiritensis]
MTRKDRIETALLQQINPAVLTIHDESNRHHVPQGAETHFKIILVAEAFSGLKTVERHRMINHLLAREFQNGLHALSLHLHTPAEWQKKGGAIPESPPCRDGYHHG